MLKEIDVSYAQGNIDWEEVRRGGVSFAMVKVSQGKLLSDASVGPFTDRQFRRNLEGAARAGIAVGVYHYLCAADVPQALAEADFFLNAIRPYREVIRLWAACDAEETRYLPREKRALTGVIHGFLKKVRAAGYAPMLYTNPDFIRYRLGDLSLYDLWLAYWNAPEARALTYNPKIWQYGAGSLGALRQVDMNRGYFTLP